MTTALNEMSRSNPQPSRREPVSDRRYVFSGGKYKGFTLDDVMFADPGYLVWLHKNTQFFKLSPDLLDMAENGGRSPEKFG